MIFSIAHWSVLTSYVQLWSQEFGQNPGLYGKTMLLVGVFENILDVRQCIHDLGVSFAFTRRSEGGGTVQSLASLSSLSSCCHPAMEVRGTEPRVKEPKISTLVWSPLVNGEVCLRYYGYYSLHIKYKITLPDPWCEVWFEYCVLCIKHSERQPFPSPPTLRSFYPQGRAASGKGTLGSCILCLPALTECWDEGKSTMLSSLQPCVVGQNDLLCRNCSLSKHSLQLCLVTKHSRALWEWGVHLLLRVADKVSETLFSLPIKERKCAMKWKRIFLKGPPERGMVERKVIKPRVRSTPACLAVPSVQVV